MYIVKHNFILGGMCYYTKAQLHVSALTIGHLQVVHENLSIGYTNLSGVYRGRCGISFVSERGGGTVCLVYIVTCVSIYSYV
jgi:hypothetical protein